MAQAEARPAEVPSGLTSTRPVALAFTLLALANVYGFYFIPLVLSAHEDLGTADKAVISSAAAIFSLSAAGFMFLLGWLLNRFPVRAIAFGGSLVTATAVLALGRASDGTGLVIGFVLLGLGFVCTGPVVYTTFVVQRYPESAERQVGLVMTGLSLGGVIVTPVLSLAIARWGLPAVAPYAALFHVVAVGIPACVGLRVPHRRAPRATADAHLLADTSTTLPAGTAPAPANPVQAVTAPLAPTSPPSRVRVLWVGTVGVLVLVTQVGLSTQLIALARPLGAVTVQLVVPLLALSAVVTRIAVAAVLTRVSPRALLLQCTLIQTAALALAATATHPVMLLVAVAAFGFSIGNAPAAFPVLVLETVGGDRYAGTYSRMSALLAVTSAAATAAFGTAVQLTGGFLLPTLVTALLTAIGGALLMGTPR